MLITFCLFCPDAIFQLWNKRSNCTDSILARSMITGPTVYSLATDVTHCYNIAARPWYPGRICCFFWPHWGSYDSKIVWCYSGINPFLRGVGPRGALLGPLSDWIFNSKILHVLLLSLGPVWVACCLLRSCPFISASLLGWLLTFFVCVSILPEFICMFTDECLVRVLSVIETQPCLKS